MESSRPVIVGVGGIASNVGKTTLMCDLLQRLPGWEAIKTTKGHYRSCGKEPSSCCVSHLLRDDPIVLSGKQETYQHGKDTGRYWNAGAQNVHWVIAASSQLSDGIGEALKRVRSHGVLIEGNTFTDFVDVDLMIIVATNIQTGIKSSARKILPRASFLFTSKPGQIHPSARDLAPSAPEYTQSDLVVLVDQIKTAALDSRVLREQPVRIFTENSLS